MKIEVGKTYLTRLDASVKIIMKTGIADPKHDICRPYLGSNGLRYTEKGDANRWSIEGQSLNDLVAVHVVDPFDLFFGVPKTVVVRPAPKRSPIKEIFGVLGAMVLVSLLSQR